MQRVVCWYREQDLLPLARNEPADDALRSHLEQCSLCQQRLQRLRDEGDGSRCAAPASTADDSYRLRELLPATPPPPEPAAPSAIGKYLVVGKLGQGAQATAYRALHPELHKELVIKYGELPAFLDPEGRDALTREARILAQLEHPHLARVYDCGLHEGHPFLVMDYVRGLALPQYRAQHRPGPRAAAALVARLAEAAGAAHRLGVVHQDVKPGNVVVADGGKPYLLDFGLARMVDVWSTGNEQPDGGTAAYMAPEQARREAGKIGSASDIFALGGILYFLLTGRPPFAGENWSEARRRAAACDFDRAALRARGIPRALAAICLKALAAKIEDRYARAEDLAADLEAYLNRPRRLLLLGAAAALLAGLAALWVFWPRTPPAPVEVVQPPPRQHLLARLQRPGSKNPDFVVLEEAVELTYHTPLRIGDIVELDCEVPHGYPAGFFLVNSAGAVHELAAKVTGTAAGLDRVRAPAEGFWQLEGPAGPLLFLACAGSRQRPRLDEVRLLVQETAQGPVHFPEPQERFLFLLNRDEALERQRDVIQTPLSRLRDRLERLREAAASRFDYFWGVALPLR